MLLMDLKILSLKVLMLLLSTKTNNKIVRTDERTDRRVVCKIVFSITFNISFWCSKEPSHREDSFEHRNVYLKI